MILTVWGIFRDIPYHFSFNTSLQSASSVHPSQINTDYSSLDSYSDRSGKQAYHELNISLLISSISRSSFPGQHFKSWPLKSHHTWQSMHMSFQDWFSIFSIMMVKVTYYIQWLKPMFFFFLHFVYILGNIFHLNSYVIQSWLW